MLLLWGAPAASLEITLDTQVPEYVLDDFLNLTGGYTTTVDNFVDDSTTDFIQGTLRNLTVLIDSLELEPSLDVTMLNGGNGVLYGGRSTDWDYVLWSFSIKKVNGTYYLYYCAGPSWGHDSAKDIGLATSTDGISFTKHSSNPVLTHGTHNSVFSPVPYYNGTWHLFYSANDGGEEGTRDIYGNYAYSDDGVNWTDYTNNPVLPNGNPNNVWDGLQAQTECIINDNGTYKLYYTGDTGNTNDWQTGLTTSTDGVTWKKNINNPVYTGNPTGWDKGNAKINSIEMANGSYRAFVTGDISSSKVGWIWSKDGITWQDSGSALISRKMGTIYSTSLGLPGLIDEGDHYKLYTMCNRGTPTRAIGVFKLVPENLDGTYTSRVFDAGGVVRLINATWDAGFTVTGNLDFQIRYGNGTGSLGDWTSLTIGDELANITARYYQYRIDLDVPKDWMKAFVNKVEIYYEAPLIKVEAFVDGGASIDCDYNATGWSANLSMDDGEHSVTVRVTDTFGEVDEVTFDIKVDLYPPTGNITIEEGRWAHNSTNVFIEVEANDTHPPLEMQLSRQPDFSGATWGPWIAQETWQMIGSPQGSVTIYMRLRDDAGRVSVTYSDSIVIDTTAPEGSLLINGGAKYTISMSVDLSINWSDITGVVAMMVSNDPDFEGALWEDPRTAMGWTIGDGEGVHTVHVRIRDAVGWVTTLTDDIILDRTPPAASISIDHDAQFCTSRDVTLGLTMYDDNPINFKLANSGDPWPDSWRTTGSPVDIPWTLTPGPDGHRTVRMLVRDAAGNEYVTSDDIVLDTTPPEGQLLLNDGAAFTNKVVASATLEASDATSGLVRIRISDSDDFSDVSWQTMKNSFSWPLPSGDGTKTVYVQLRDAAGLVATVDASIILDTTPPTGSFLVEGGAEFVTSSTVNLAIQFQDAFGLEGIRVSNQPSFGDAVWLPFSTGLVWELGDEEGEWVVHLQVRDNAGNVASATSTTKLDLSNPEVELVINGGDEATLELSVLLTWSASDPSGLVAYALADRLDFSVAQWTNLSGEAAIEDATLTYTSAGIDGLKTVYLRVRNASGRTGTVSDTIWYVSSKPEGRLVVGDGSGWTNSTVIEARVEWTGGSQATHFRASLIQEGLELAQWVPIDGTALLEPDEPGGTFMVHCLLLGPHNVTSERIQESVNQDLMAPVVDIVSPKVEVTEEETAKLRVSVTDDMDTDPVVEWRLNGGEWTAYEGDVRLSLKEGKNHIEVRARDAAGNQGTSEWTIESERVFLVSGSSYIILIIIVLVIIAVATLYWWRQSRMEEPPA
ncbi:MAG: hypothetical protein KAJ35_08430 [Thermoplasmata archaeon]|nr:hypothetical protein [Thermoplasmata archaeon]